MEFDASQCLDLFYEFVVDLERAVNRNAWGHGGLGMPPFPILGGGFLLHTPWVSTVGLGGHMKWS